MGFKIDGLQISGLIGSTPFFKLETENGVTVWIKLEGTNPGGSVKDRAAWGMLRFAERDGLLKDGAVIVEPTSGNTGISLAMLGRALGFRVILTMPESMSVERRAVLAAYGAELVLTPAADGMRGAVEKARVLEKEVPGAFVPDQFSNPGNPWAHSVTTGPEILAALKGVAPSVFVAGVGTGGTLSGAGSALKAAFPEVRVVAVEPEKSPLLSGGKAASHGIQGIGANFIPDNLDLSLLGGVVDVPDEAAQDTARWLARDKNLFTGISTGANVWAALELAKDLKPGEHIVTISPDRGDKYLSTTTYRLPG